MSEPLVLVRDEGPVRWLTLNRPDKRNALSPELIGALDGALGDCGAARCVAITGAGSAFSAGADLRALQEMREASYERNLADSRLLARLLESIAAHPLPVIAAVNGHALGGGAGLAMACDLAVGVSGAQFGFTEVRIGFIPAIVMNFLLRKTGETVARDLCLTGRRLGMQEAGELGLFWRVCEAGDLEPTVADLGARIARAGPEAVARTKRLFSELRHLPLDEGLVAAAEANAHARATEECQEGIAAFLEKRKPRWSAS